LTFSDVARKLTLALRESGKTKIGSISVDGKCLKIRHGAQKLSAAVFCKGLNLQFFPAPDAKNRYA
jgi:hypothetical protein